MEAPPESYVAVSYPHPYLLIWLECRRQANAMTGALAYPDPEKGYLDQDAELMLALEVLEECYAQHEELKKRQEDLREETVRRFGGGGD